MRVKKHVHDGRRFYWTTASVNSHEDIIGFYFDDNNFAMPVRRDSLYGGYIIAWEKEFNQ